MPLADPGSSEQEEPPRPSSDPGADPDAVRTDPAGQRSPAGYVAECAPLRDVGLRDGVRFAAWVFAAVWICWSVLGAIGVLIVSARDPVSVPGLAASPLTTGWHNALTAGQRGDALWFQRIASRGYRSDDASAAFFPLYPLTIRVVSTIPGADTAVAAALVAQASFFGALVVLYALTARELGADVARRATVYLAVFPTAFFFLAAYSESLFLLLTLLAFWYARAGRWWPAVVPAVLVGLTRSVGVMVAAALLVEAVLQWRRSRRRLLPALAAAAAPLVGLGLYATFWAAHGDAMAPVKAQDNWQRQATLMPLTLLHAVQAAWRYQSYWLIDLLVVGIIIGAVAAGLRLLPASYLTYAILSLLLPLSEPFPARPLMSMPRFVSVVFPAFWVIAVAVHRRKLPESAVVGVFACGYALLGLLFMNWQYIF